MSIAKSSTLYDGHIYTVGEEIPDGIEEGAEAEAPKPKSVKPKAKDPKSVKPKAKDPKSVKPKAKEPDVPDPSAVKPPEDDSETDDSKDTDIPPGEAIPTQA